MKGKNTIFLAMGLLFFLAMPHQVSSCVGRILNLAVTDSADQQVMGRLLATYITERTGTTVNLVKAPDLDTARKMVREGKANIYLNYIGEAAKEMAGTSGATPQETYALLKQAYLEKFGLVWLKPFGYTGPSDLEKEQDGGSLAAAVTSTDVLEKFPILDRLINKLAGRISRETLVQLRQDAAGSDLAVVAKNFLKKKNLI